MAIFRPPVFDGTKRLGGEYLSTHRGAHAAAHGIFTLDGAKNTVMTGMGRQTPESRGGGSGAFDSAKAPDENDRRSTPEGSVGFEKATRQHAQGRFEVFWRHCKTIGSARLGSCR